jgi:hypothetical protein
MDGTESNADGEELPAYPEWEHTAWQGEWRASDFGECETRPCVAESSRGFHPGLSVSYGGGDCTPSYHHQAHLTLEEAIEAAVVLQSSWGDETYALPAPDPSPDPASAAEQSAVSNRQNRRPTCRPR